MPDPINLSAVLPFYLAALVGGYLCGSIPFGLLLTRVAGAGDIRSIGSGNIGATNVLRTGRKDLAAATLLLDIVKGATPILMAGQFSPDLLVFAGAGAFLGHLFPVWLGFKGGKGIAVACGIVTAMAWPVGLLSSATWALTALTFRISSLGSLYTASMTPFYFWLIDWRFAPFAAVMAMVIWAMHRPNIARLWAGTEPRIGGGSTSKQSKTGASA